MDIYEREMVNQALTRLKGIVGIDWTILEDLTSAPFDMKVQINGVVFIVQIKKTISNANVISVINQMANIIGQTRLPVLLVTSQIYPKLMTQLEDNGVSVVDMAGNANISHDGLMVKVAGQKVTAEKDKKVKRINETGLKLILYFLENDANINKIFREIQSETGVSLGSVQKAIDLLKAKGFLLITSNGRFIKHREQLIDWWQEQYNSFLKPKLLIRRMAFRSDQYRREWRDITLPKGMYWGGDCAANIVDGYLIPGDYEIYTDVPTPVLLQTGKFKMDDEGEIRVYRKFWNGADMTSTVPKLIIYSDLMGSGDSRCYEAAKRLMENGI